MASEPAVSAALAASGRSSEKSVTLMRKKLWRSDPLQQSFVIVRLGDHDGGKDGIRDGEQRDGKEGRRAGAWAVVRPAAALQGEAESGGSAVMRRSIAFTHVLVV